MHDKQSILEHTFLHLTGVGRRHENALWSAGIGSWTQLDRALRDGVSASDLIRKDSRFGLQLGLDSVFHDLHSPPPPWLAEIAVSREALACRDLTYFTNRLPSSEYWRILASSLDDALYLDIETTGLSRDLHSLTLVGAVYRGETYQWVWPEPLDELAEMIRSAALVVTFNGIRFDIPFLLHHVASMPAPRVHVDLRTLASMADLSGGQKSAEQALGLSRGAELQGLDGEGAIALWCRTLYGDTEAYRTLVAYNRADVQMLRPISERLCAILARTLPAPWINHPLPKGDQQMALFESTVQSSTNSLGSTRGRAPASHAIVQEAWRKRRVTLDDLLPVASASLRRPPIVVGIDLRTKEHNPTGWVRSEGRHIETQILYDDDSIFERTIQQQPDLVSIDAPLSLPRGRQSVFDDSPCRAAGGIVRDAERVLWSRGIRVYPALIKHMQGLTARGIALAMRLRDAGIAVIESYPGAAQDVLGIARKGVDLSLLAQGLVDFGFLLPDGMSHDELDAVTCALVGYFYLANKYEAIGAEDENFMIIPRANSIQWDSLRKKY